MKQLCLAIALLMASAQAVANQPAVTSDATAIVADQLKLQEEVKSRIGRGEGLSPAQRQEIAKNQALVLELLGGVATVGQLPEEQRVRAFNALQAIDKSLAGDSAERMVCQRHKPTGSNRVVTTCKTARERELEREHAQRQMIVGPNNNMGAR